MEKYQQQLNVLVFDSSSKNERRKHPRYKMNKNILSISEDVLAEVVDISEAGISCKCLASFDKLLIQIYKIELLNCELGTSVEGLHGRLIRSSNRAISLALSSTIIMNFSLEFQDLTQIKRKQLFQFIKYGEGVVSNTKILSKVLSGKENEMGRISQGMRGDSDREMEGLSLKETVKLRA
jgi:hypothetical protein